MPLTLKEVQLLHGHLKAAQNMRDFVLFSLAVDCCLMACDLVMLRVSDVSKGRQVATQATITQSRSNNPIQFQISL